MTPGAKLLGQGKRSIKEQLNAVLWENGKCSPKEWARKGLRVTEVEEENIPLTATACRLMIFQEEGTEQEVS